MNLYNDNCRKWFLPSMTNGPNFPSFNHRITTKGERKTGKDDSGKPYVYYHYSQPGYSDNGVKKELTFDSVLPRSLKMHAYLKVGYNDKRQQVINWEKVDRKDIPQAA
ncbi:hypothetical protein WP50_36045, partial [Lactiplantibacillus plantarum]